MQNSRNIITQINCPIFSMYQNIYESYVKLNQDFIKISQSNKTLQNLIQQKIKQTSILKEYNEKIKKEYAQNGPTQIGQDLRRTLNQVYLIKQNQQKILNYPKKQRNVKCPFQDCSKRYQTPVSLNLHMKIKHQVGPMKQRLLYAKLIKQSIQNGTELPNLNISLPPKFLQEYLEKKSD